MLRKSGLVGVVVLCLLALVAPSVLAQDDGITFTSWSLNEELAGSVIRPIIDTYESASGVTVSEVAYPYNEYLNQVILQANGGQLSGAVQMDIAWMATLSGLGVLADLGPYVEEGVYTEAGLQACQVDGVQYGLPWATASIGMVANQELLTAAGITELPTTIEEFEAALETLKAYNPDVIPYAGMTDVAQLKDIIPWIWTFGGDVFDADGNVVLTSEQTVAAEEWYAGLLERGLIAPDVDRFDARQLFAQGLVGFYDDAILARSLAAANAAEGVEITVVPVPRPVLAEGDAPQSLRWGHCVVVLNDANTEAAANFAVYLTSDEAANTTFFEQLGLPPASLAVVNSEAFQSDGYTATWTEQITATTRTNPFSFYAEGAQMETTLNDASQAILIGDETAADALAEAAEDISDMVADAR